MEIRRDAYPNKLIAKKNNRLIKIRKHNEIDFVCNRRSKRYCIQSALQLHDENKKRQEERPLLLTKDGFKKVIITKDALAPLYNEEGILVMNVFDFLMDEASLDYGTANLGRRDTWLNVFNEFTFILNLYKL